MRTLIETRAPMRYCLVDTDQGAIGIGWSDQGITRLQLPEKDRDATERRLRGRGRDAEAAHPAPAIRDTIDGLKRYMAGERIDFSSAAIDLAGAGDFHRSIYELARRVGWGKTTTYGELARMAGAPEAARAVGQAMGRNPVPIIIPCHRVLASGGKIGGFSAFGGRIAKERLLAMEGVHPGSGTPLLPGLLGSGSRH